MVQHNRDNGTKNVTGYYLVTNTIFRIKPNEFSANDLERTSQIGDQYSTTLAELYLPRHSPPCNGASINKALLDHHIGLGARDHYAR